MERVVNLTTPIQAHGQDISSLTFREPTLGDIADLGYPMTILSNGVHPVASIIQEYIVRLAKIPRSSVRNITPSDFNSCLGEILNFFGEEAIASSNGDSMSPMSGSSDPQN